MCCGSPVFAELVTRFVPGSKQSASDVTAARAVGRAVDRLQTGKFLQALSAAMPAPPTPGPGQPPEVLPRHRQVAPRLAVPPASGQSSPSEGPHRTRFILSW